MNEDELRALLEQDRNLRDAIRQEEAESPQMPADLNARVMQRTQPLPVSEGGKVRRLWPWIAAACVAGFMMVLLTPPKDRTTGTDLRQQMAEKVEPKQAAPRQDTQQKAAPPQEAPAQKEAPKQMAQSTPEKQKKSQPTAVEAEPQSAPAETALAETTLAETTLAETTPAETALVETTLAETAKPIEEKAPAIAQAATTTLSERDIPITRPENYEYTPEEIALMKKQANEAYLKWVELELQIAKYHLEQTAQK